MEIVPSHSGQVRPSQNGSSQVARQTVTVHESPMRTSLSLNCQNTQYVTCNTTECWQQIHTYVCMYTHTYIHTVHVHSNYNRSEKGSGRGRESRGSACPLGSSKPTEPHHGRHLGVYPTVKVINVILSFVLASLSSLPLSPLVSLVVLKRRLLYTCKGVYL